MGKLGWFVSRTQTFTSPPREGEPAGTAVEERERERDKNIENKKVLLTFKAAPPEKKT